MDLDTVKTVFSESLFHLISCNICTFLARPEPKQSAPPPPPPGHFVMHLDLEEHLKTTLFCLPKHIVNTILSFLVLYHIKRIRPLLPETRDPLPIPIMKEDKISQKQGPELDQVKPPRKEAKESWADKPSNGSHNTDANEKGNSTVWT